MARENRIFRAPALGEATCRTAGYVPRACHLYHRSIAPRSWTPCYRRINTAYRFDHGSIHIYLYRVKTAVHASIEMPFVVERDIQNARGTMRPPIGWFEGSVEMFLSRRRSNSCKVEFGFFFFFLNLSWKIGNVWIYPRVLSVNGVRNTWTWR